MSGNNDEYNRGGLIAFSFAMAFSIAFILYIVLFQKVELGENVVDPTAFAQKTGEAAIEFNIDKITEPWLSSDDMIAYGKKVYTTNCAMCHGAEGKGNGPAGAALNPPPRNLVEGKWTKGNGAINHFKVVTNGIPGTSMAGYSHFKVGDRWALVHFIESITQNKSKDSEQDIAEFGKKAK